MKIGLMHTAYRKSPEALVSKAAKFGFDGVEFTPGWSEWGSFSPLDYEKSARKRLKEMIESEGLKISNLSPRNNFTTPDMSVREKELLAFRAYLDLANDLEVDLVRVTQGHLYPSVAYEKQWEACVECIKRCLKMADDLGITLFLDNHFFASLADNVDMIAEIGSENLKMNVDVGNAAAQGEDCLDIIRKNRRLIVHTHVKDFKRIDSIIETGFGRPGVFQLKETKRLRWVAIGDGEVDVKGFVKTLRDVNYEGFLSIENEGAESMRSAVDPDAPDETVKKGLAYLRKLIG